MTISLISRIGRSLRYRLLHKPYAKFLRPLIAPTARKFLQSREDFKPEVIVMVDGGLGSQMGQYALGRAVGLACGLPVSYDLSWYDKGGMDINGIHTRNYELESVFPNIRVIRAEESTARRYRLFFNLYPGTYSDYIDELYESKAARYLGGYYVNTKYIDSQGDALRDLFEFNLALSKANRDVLDEIDSCACPAAIHIRRGDYVGSVHDVTTVEYFRRAQALISERAAPLRPHFFVFSNGMDWARDALRNIDEKFTFVENNDNAGGAVDMFLMSQCSHFIISNSSFSWWPAWLSRRAADKTVIMPESWIKTQDISVKYCMKPEGWTTLPV